MFLNTGVKNDHYIFPIWLSLFNFCVFNLFECIVFLEMGFWNYIQLIWQFLQLVYGLWKHTYSSASEVPIWIQVVCTVANAFKNVGILLKSIWLIIITSGQLLNKFYFRTTAAFIYMIPLLEMIFCYIKAFLIKVIAFTYKR